jgi:predicted nucleic acid-binding Zn ribbon protein
VRRLGPRPLSAALEPVRRDLAPATTLARVQEAWASVAGLAAKEAAPVSERSGTVTFACRSAVWASELTLMAGDLRERLSAALGDNSVTDLRFVTRSS